MSLIKIGVVGVGSMGVNHCKVLQKIKNVQFVGVFDINQERNEQVANMFAVTAFSSYEELMNGADAVIIAAPTFHHFSLIVQAIQKGKHVLVEKPLVTSLKEAEHIITMVEKESVIVQVGHIERFNPVFKQLSYMMKMENVISLEARRFGVPYRHIDTDVILDLMIHDIDIILQLVKSPLSNVTGVGYYGKDGQLEGAAALLSFQNGCFASLLSSRLSLEKKRSLYVTEKNRFLKANLLAKELYIYHEITKPLTSIRSYHPENIIEKVAIPHAEALYLEIEHFVQSIQTKHSPKVGVHEAAKVLEVALRIKEQIEKNK
ncbi:Gfo/Idh/MocA family oxidoreductase [Metabacillus herbersteinensis]|uniref:Gfo/Idh/MocA family oxidoreductase n=1 Tax=Metabacillus herbersteinensis TaxID=283816 RepID=A0ABV6GHJ1_9BACI